MNFKSSVIVCFERLLSPLGIRLVSIAANRVRGIDPYLDLSSLLNNKSEPLIFDVGANNGEVAGEFLRAFPNARLVAFEPFGECYASLKELFAGRQNVKIENIALGAAAGMSEMNLYSGSNMNSMLQIEAQPMEALQATINQVGKKVGTVSVKVDTIDNYCNQNGLDWVDVLKIDTQGFDLNVLKGASEILKAHHIRALLVEVNFIPMYQGQASFLQIHEFLNSMGYRLVDFYNHARHNGYTAWCDACYVVDK